MKKYQKKLKALENELKSVEIDFHYAARRREACLSRINSNETIFEDLEEDSALLAGVHKFLELLSENRRQSLIQMVESLATQALQAIFQRSDYQFRLRFGTERNNVVCRPFLVSEFQGQCIETSLLEGHGGGIWDIVSLVLRIVVVVFQNSRRFLALDEPFRFCHLTDDQWTALGTFLQKLCKDLGFQIVIVSARSKVFSFADKKYRFSLDVMGNTEMSEL